MTADRKLDQTRRMAYRAMGLDVDHSMSVHTMRADKIREILDEVGINAWDLEVKQYVGMHIATWSGDFGIARAIVIDDTDTDEQIKGKANRARKDAFPTEHEFKARAVYKHHAPDAATMDKLKAASGANGEQKPKKFIDIDELEARVSQIETEIVWLKANH